MVVKVWLATQDSAFQDRVLGKTQAELFRNGGLTPKDFANLQLDKNFRPLTLAEIKKIEPLGFDKAFKTAKPISDATFAESLRMAQMTANSTNKAQSMSFRKRNALGQKWVVANISKNVQQTLGAKTGEVWLSDDTLMKMVVHHPEQANMTLFSSVQRILDGATKVVKKDDLNVVYFSQQGKNYIVVVKATKDRKELYLTTIYQADEKEFYRQIKKATQ
ncbi:hypothetical protein B0181_02095 [Moraxella caviae]|uniref:Phage-Barnase-EndoU-ColicinE5/D-RelE like nuclease 3 domain-containing protein n=1 Tax=Moraxella caviae TaxID=34060 RepID=A0A1T0A8N8_9GAMM|nr:hypothetical protein [Moraxella caviae]OOR92093.1 hypothetical protein B0181_02095 [Moraxella caviae]STZ14449.1 Uncharacterised protein [Moraxella caviae]VEW10464.1 Uncharacterised protein [Moraxella caviae]